VVLSPIYFVGEHKQSVSENLKQPGPSRELSFDPGFFCKVRSGSRNIIREVFRERGEHGLNYSTLSRTPLP
jgi:hypothetical protein